MSYFARLLEIWPAGSTAEAYFSSLEYYRNFVRNLYGEATPSDDDVARFSAAVGGAAESLRVVVVTEDWCGDSAVTVPYIARLAEAAGVPLRIFRQSVFTDLKEWYVADGATHIPTVSVIDTSGDPPQERFRWIERPGAAHGRVKAWVAEHPEFPELRKRKDSDDEASKAYFKLYAQLLRDMAGWYRSGLWSEIAREFAEGLEN